MKKYLALDSGGTKMLAILYDEDFYPIAISRVGTIRKNVNTPEKAEENAKQLIDELGIKDGDEIEHVSGFTEAFLLDRLSQKAKIGSYEWLSEPKVAYCAAGIFGDGINAVSGTGSNCCAHYKGEIYESGGHGSVIADLASGYWIGRQGMIAAIADHEGFGEPTLLTDYLAGHFGYDREHLRDAFSRVYFDKSSAPITHVASCAKIVSRAADDGDRIALEILKAAGELMGKRFKALVVKNSIPDDIPVTVSGSVWRGNRIFFDTFAKAVREQSPNRPIKLQNFEQIIGIIIKHYYDLYGHFTDADKAKFEKLYPQYVLKLHYDNET